MSFYAFLPVLTGASKDVELSFAVQRHTRYGFSAVPCDQTIEQTLNRGAKTKGRLVRFKLIENLFKDGCFPKEKDPQ